MHLGIGEKVSATSIQGNNVTGNVTAILENTVIVYCGAANHVVKKKELKKQGYKFVKAAKGAKTIVVSSNRNLKK
ncbi:hypothetical protein [Carnobacterium maltaromaticum]|uniref:hypothetical protein n=1 Tax=Carnobacterium maltaromaticum TaxID=2751 RepID=UPI0012F85822|nr:hypothetical protein [Carnobacterium maltaromaticum]